MVGHFPPPSTPITPVTPATPSQTLPVAPKVAIAAGRLTLVKGKVKLTLW